MVYRRIFKPVVDFLVSIGLFIILLPVFLTILFLLIIANQGSPFFFQRRPGKNSRIFKVIKFKTMNDRKDQFGNILPDSDRLTRLGRFIRKTSLDEIPQLLNVIKGDMSLIGPRPLLVEYLPLYDEYQRRRHEIKPGITGWAQVNGRNALTWSQKFEYDVWYVDHISAGLDFKILWLTVAKVFKSEGINQEGHVTMEKFTGTI